MRIPSVCAIAQDRFVMSKTNAGKPLIFLFSMLRLKSAAEAKQIDSQAMRAPTCRLVWVVDNQTIRQISSCQWAGDARRCKVWMKNWMRCQSVSREEERKSWLVWMIVNGSRKKTSKCPIWRPTRQHSMEAHNASDEEHETISKSHTFVCANLSSANCPF